MTTARTSILALLAAGILLSSGGVAMGVSGLGASVNAGEAQYPPPKHSAPTVLPASQAQPAAVAQPTAQEAVKGSTLPFTGYAAIPVLLLGLGLLLAGVVTRRRAREHC